MEKLKLWGRNFLNRANSITLFLLLGALYCAGIGFTRLLAEVFARARLRPPQPGWREADVRQTLEEAKRQS
ncbi:MAG: hypothetical protein GX410_03495 [Elusimicrobia bacterium]|nr:hypothetical protein [Elusimicrobiota bacterium]